MGGALGFEVLNTIGWFGGYSFPPGGATDGGGPAKQNISTFQYQTYGAMGRTVDVWECTEIDAGNLHKLT